MGPKWLPKGSLEASGRALGGISGPLGLGALLDDKREDAQRLVKTTGFAAFGRLLPGALRGLWELRSAVGEERSELEGGFFEHFRV